MNQPTNRNPLPPACGFKVRPRFKAGHISKAKIGQHRHRLGDADHPLQCLVVQNTDPADTDAFGTSRQPEILNGTARAIQIRLAHGRTTQDMRTATPPAAGHTNIDRRFLNAFKFQASVEICPAACIADRRPSIGFIEQPLHRSLGRTVTDDDKIPWLHEPDRTGMMRGRQQASQHSVRNRRRQKITTNVAALKNGAIDRLALNHGERVARTIMVSGSAWLGNRPIAMGL